MTKTDKDFFLVVIHGIKIILHVSEVVPFEVKLCSERFVTIFTLEGFTWFLGYLDVFFLVLVLCLMRLHNLEIPFHKFYTSYHLLVDQYHLHKMPLEFMYWSVSCFYVLSAYLRSYNSKHK